MEIEQLQLVAILTNAKAIAIALTKDPKIALPERERGREIRVEQERPRD